MNHREPTSVPKGPGQAFPCLALLLLPLLMGGRATACPQPTLQAGPIRQKSYLVALGSPPLRFQDPALQPDRLIRPPKPGEANSTSLQVSDPGRDVIGYQTPESTTESLPGTNTPDSTSQTSTGTDSSTSAPTRIPLPILRDEMRPQARAEDFLPYFQIPVNQPGDMNVIMPAPHAPMIPNSLPSSSATYTQTPR